MWPGIRSVLIALVLFFCVAEAMPLPTLKKRHMNRTVAQDEAQRWVDILATVGVETNREALVAKVLQISRKTGKIRNKVIKPWRKVERTFGMGQKWALFTFTDPYPGRMVIEGRGADGVWRDLYRAPSNGEPELVNLMNYRRVRGIWDDSGDRPYPGKLFDRWVTWLGGRIFSMYPEVDVMRIRFDRVEVTLPWARPSSSAEETVYQRQRHREDYR